MSAVHFKITGAHVEEKKRTTSDYSDDELGKSRDFFICVATCHIFMTPELLQQS